jgi:hypothetical protein
MKYDIPGMQTPQKSDDETPQLDPTKLDILKNLVQEAALNIIRQTSKINFWADSLSESLGEHSLARWLKVPTDQNYQSHSMVAAIRHGGKEYHSFEIEVRQKEDILEVIVKLKEEFEWRDAWEEAWKLAGRPNTYFLTDNALKLFNWLKSGKYDGKHIDENMLGRRANLRGPYHHIHDYLTEIQAKADQHLVFETVEGGGWRPPLKIAFQTDLPEYYNLGPLNPELQLFTTSIAREQIERFKAWLYATIQKTPFRSNKDVMGIFDIRDRKTLNSCFAVWPEGFCFDDKLKDFFEATKLVPGIELACKFEDGLAPWIVICRLEKGSTWKGVQERLKEMSEQVPLDKKYGLNPESCVFRNWILNLHPNEYLRSLTPPVEDHLAVDIGLAPDWPEENVPAYIELLIEEINEKTEFDLRTQPWRHYNEEQTRIRVKKKKLELENLVRMVQLYGLSKSRVLTDEQIKKAIEALLTV